MADLIQGIRLSVQRSSLLVAATIQGFEASRVLSLVRSKEMNNAIYRAGHLQNIISMDQASLERRRSFMARFSCVRSDALGGVILLTRKTPVCSLMMTFG